MSRPIYAYEPVLSFGGALKLLKLGEAVARAGWNGKGMFVYMVPAASYPAQTGVAQAYFGKGSLVPYNAYFALKGADGTVSTWVPSSTDLMAEDWMLIDPSAANLLDPPKKEKEGDFLDRLQREHKELIEKLDKLVEFLGSDRVLSLTRQQRELLEQQSVHMNGYRMILAARLSAYDL